jgi:hypothetical protein
MLLLLDMQCEAFTKLVKPSQISNSTKKRKRFTVAYDTAGIPIPSVARDTEEVINTNRFIQVYSAHFPIIPFEFPSLNI